MLGSRSLLAALALPATLAVVLMVAHPEAEAFDYVDNGSFEAGAAGWSTAYASLDIVDAGPLAPVDGAQMARLTLTEAGTEFRLTRSLDTTLDSGAYVFRAYVGVTAGLTSARAYMTFSTPELHLRTEEIDGSVPGSWRVIEKQFVAQAGDTLTSVSIVGTGSAGAVVYVDAVSLDGAPPITPVATATNSPTETPEPPPVGTATKTPVPTRTAAATRTPSRTPEPTATLAAISDSITNGGFEEVDSDGVPVAWTKYGGALATTNGVNRSGSRAARFDSSTASTKWFYQAVSVSGSSTYEFDAWLLHDDPGIATAYLRISWYATADAEGAALSSHDSTARLDARAPAYRYLTTGGVTAPIDALSARLRVMLAPASPARATLYVDDASFGPATRAETAAATSSEAARSAAAGTSRRARPADAQETVAGGPGTTQGVGAIVINEVLYDSAAPGEDAEHEWIELYNGGNSTVDLAGWTVADGVSSDALPGQKLAPGAFAIVAASNRFHDSFPTYSGQVVILGGRLGNGLGNEGDRLVLADPSGKTADAVSWGDDGSALAPAVDDVPAGHSIERRLPGFDTGAASDFVDNESPSPGAAYLAPTRQRGTAASDGTRIFVRHGGAATPRWIWFVAGVSAALLAAVTATRLAPILRQRFARAR